MSIALLDVNDCNLQLWNGDAHLQSPGYALLEGQQYRFRRTGKRCRPHAAQGYQYPLLVADEYRGAAAGPGPSATYR